jgi:hypothetical protein
MYKMLDGNDLKSIFASAIEEKWGSAIPVDGDRFEQLYHAFLEYPCRYDYSKFPNEEARRFAREFLDSSAAQEILNKESVCG